MTGAATKHVLVVLLRLLHAENVDKLDSTLRVGNGDDERLTAVAGSTLRANSLLLLLPRQAAALVAEPPPLQTPYFRNKSSTEGPGAEGAAAACKRATEQGGVKVCGNRETRCGAGDELVDKQTGAGATESDTYTDASSEEALVGAGEGVGAERALQGVGAERALLLRG